MRYTISFITALVILWVLQSALLPGRPIVVEADDDALVQDVLHTLGEAQRGDNVARTVSGASMELGASIVLQGIGDADRRQSKHFVCTSCHNIVPEGPLDDPEARLSYAAEKGLPFLPGTTLYGAVNRETYYNDDYEKKYGDLVKPARRDLRAAIQLCATECAQGRPLSEVEMESVVVYLQNIGLRLKDLALTEQDKQHLNAALNNQVNDAAVRDLLKSKFATASPATFLIPPEDRRSGYGLQGDPNRGALVYELACLHCHGEKRYSFYELGKDPVFYRHLERHFPRYTRYSTYQVVRYGTSPIPGKKAYMPHYTQERMSNQQVEDLRAFLTDGAR
ncbi:MAG: cytochrome c [Bacteroidota bacterium]